VKLGIESGFYSLYSVEGTYYYDDDLNPQFVKSYLNVVPILFNVSTRIYDELYASVGVGLANMQYGSDGFGSQGSVWQ
jgi:hypothetical protein